MADKKYSKVKSTTLVSILIHGANELGITIARNLIEQGSRVIVVDNFDKDSKPFVARLKKLGNADFIAFEGIQDLFKVLSRFDYLFYLQNELLYQDKDFGSKGFLEESNHLEQALKAAAKFNAKTTLVTTVYFNQKLQRDQVNNQMHHSSYSSAEIQKYSETLLAEYHDKSKLDARIIRLGILCGMKYPAIGDQKVQQLLYDSINKNQITILGEGLDNHYVINAKDAVYGLLKLTFTSNTKGEVITLANPKPLTTLSIAYKLLELNIEATSIKFEDDTVDKSFMRDSYAPSVNADTFGWTPQFTLEQTFVEMASGAYEESNKKWANKPSKGEISTIEETSIEEKQTDHQNEKTVKTVKTPFGRFIDKLLAPFAAATGKLTGKSGGFWKSINFKTVSLGVLSLVLLSTISYFLLTPVVTISVNGILIYRQKDDLVSAMQEFDFTKASEELETVESRFEKIEVSIDRLEWLFKATSQEDFYKNLSQMTFAASYAIEGVNEMTTALEPLALYISEFEPAIGFGGNQPTTTREYSEYLRDLQNNRSKLEKASNDIALASKLIESTDLDAFPSSMRPQIQEIKELNNEYSDLLDPFQNTITFLPELLGVEGRQRYLVLLQNPSELRSTGGWLSSYAIVGIENGQIRQLDVDDIYNLDGQLITQGLVFDPPETMQEALDIDQWSFSTSNWSADFPTAANDAEFFLKEAGKAYDIDGVVAIDVTLIQNFLAKWNGIDVPGETEKVTSDNLYDKIFEIHNDFTPGSRQKTTFIANLANSTFQRILSVDGDSYKETGDIIIDGLDQKHILVYLKNSDANSYIDSQGWSGRLRESNNSAPVPVEWNWGANKANLYLIRNTSLEVEILDEDQIRYTYTLSIQNNGENNIYPEGDYVNWMRLFIPEQANINSIDGFEKNQNQTNLEEGFKSIGGWFNTPIQETNRLKVVYTYNRNEGEYFPLSINGNDIRMNLNIFKQPGTNKDKYTVNIIYPDKWSVNESEDLNKLVNQLNTQFELESDKNISISWEYK
jgi:nucleoside-diphosphate-sugar epimerase